MKVLGLFVVFWIVVALIDWKAWWKKGMWEIFNYFLPLVALATLIIPLAVWSMLEITTARWVVPVISIGEIVILCVLLRIRNARKQMEHGH